MVTVIALLLEIKLQFSKKPNKPNYLGFRVSKFSELLVYKTHYTV